MPPDVNNSLAIRIGKPWTINLHKTDIQRSGKKFLEPTKMRKGPKCGQEKAHDQKHTSSSLKHSEGGSWLLLG